MNDGNVIDELNKLGVEIIYNTEIIDIANFNGTLNTVKDTTGKGSGKRILLLFNARCCIFSEVKF
ncbi:MAG: hypothetical protein R2942_17120 [Ignavibacteria bacterium]